MKVLVTGTAGFIGFHVANALLARGDQVVGIDNLNDYYSVELKYGRLAAAGIAREAVSDRELCQSTMHPGYRFQQLELADREAVAALFANESFDAVCHLAAQPGVRYSMENPHAYIDANITGFMNILEGCRHAQVDNLCFASSSSVYGLNEVMPFSTRDNVDHPISLYAATKKANELMAHTYAHLYGIRTTGLRFFTVYGPWGRPDMAPMLFTRAALAGEPINVYNYGEMARDFTYVDDIVAGILRVLDKPAEPDPAWRGQAPDPSSSSAAYRLYNIGNSEPVQLLDFIAAIELAVGFRIEKRLLPMQPGDVPATFADVSALEHDLGYRPNTPLQQGVDAVVRWYREFYQV